VNRVVGDHNAGRIWGTAMRVDRFKIRNFTLMTGLTVGLTMLPAASHAFRRRISGDSAPAMFSGSARRRFPAWTGSRPA
jgi:hypothetical protein